MMNSHFDFRMTFSSFVDEGMRNQHGNSSLTNDIPKAYSTAICYNPDGVALGSSPQCSANGSSILFNQTSIMTAGDSCTACSQYFNLAVSWSTGGVQYPGTILPSNNSYVIAIYTAGPPTPPTLPAYNSTLSFTGLVSETIVTAKNTPNFTLQLCSFTSLQVQCKLRQIYH